MATQSLGCVCAYLLVGRLVGSYAGQPAGAHECTHGLCLGRAAAGGPCCSAWVVLACARTRAASTFTLCNSVPFAVRAREDAFWMGFGGAAAPGGPLAKLVRRAAAVMLFVIRLLRALDFQPRMSLITRTISRASVDLIHFFVLLAIVFSGYVFAGYMAFGHQMQEFSDLTHSSLYLLFIALAFDPSIWVQVPFCL